MLNVYEVYGRGAVFISNLRHMAGRPPHMKGTTAEEEQPARRCFSGTLQNMQRTVT